MNFDQNDFRDAVRDAIEARIVRFWSEAIAAQGVVGAKVSAIVEDDGALRLIIDLPGVGECAR